MPFVCGGLGCRETDENRMLRNGVRSDEMDGRVVLSRPERYVVDWAGLG